MTLWSKVAVLFVISVAVLAIVAAYLGLLGWSELIQGLGPRN
jgi:hypothetical protein